jgi:hypothetical protein
MLEYILINLSDQEERYDCEESYIVIGIFITIMIGLIGIAIEYS